MEDWEEYEKRVNMNHVDQIDVYGWCMCEEADGHKAPDCPPEGGKQMICKECEGDGCSLCTVFCGDCLTPLEGCGCRP